MNLKRKFQHAEKGINLIENMVAMSILSLVIASASSAMIMSYHGNNTARTYSGVVSDIQGIVDGLRNGPYTSILLKFGTSAFLTITNNQTANETILGNESRATYTITYTAIKRSATSIPDAVRVRIAIAHRAGKLGNNTYSFETIIAQNG